MAVKKSIFLSFIMGFALQLSGTTFLEKAYRKYPEADLNGDGKLSKQEAIAFRNKKKSQHNEVVGLAPTLGDVSYGDHERNVLDVWLASSDKPTPLAVYIHGGGFVGGDKSKVHKGGMVQAFLDKGISVASINYRFKDKADNDTILQCMLDSKRAIQFLRYNSEKYNLDKTRIGCWGGSAGAGTSLWLGFHDEMAEPNSEDPVLRESTRLRVVGATATQSTYNFSRWADILKEALDDYEETKKENVITQNSKEMDILEWMSKEDPPFIAMNPSSNKRFTAGNKKHHGIMVHHPLHVKALKDRADEVGVTCDAHAPHIGLESEYRLVDFISEHLLSEG